MSNLEKFLLFVNVALYGFLTVFSYAYVDLNLTLSQIPLVVNFTKTMQQLGYFHRTAATSMYIIFIFSAFSFFALNLWLFLKSKVTQTYLKLATLLNTFILIFAYPFLSSDLFNYLFDAKIILKYQVSPYTHKALDFPNDEWLRFMRWTHRTSPYGPIWLMMSLIPAALGFGKFILNFLAFKIFIAAFHLINAWLIYKILLKLKPKSAIFGTSFYALNPLLLIEGVANAHNDVVLTTFLLFPILLLILKKRALSYLMIIVGTLIKYLALLNLPWFLLSDLTKKLSLERLIILNIATMTIFTFVFSSFGVSVPFIARGSTQIQFQPWYLFWTLPLISLIPNLGLILLGLVISIGALFRYLPFLYFGDWSHPGTTSFITFITFIPLFLAFALIFFKKLVMIRKSK